MLDDLNLLRERDPANCLGAVQDMPSQATFKAEVFCPEFDERKISQVIVAGMGGSALAADMVSVLTRGWLQLPMTVVKGYELPAYIGKNTLVVTVSHSGNTEETLSCFEQALQAGCLVGVMASGGKLLELAEASRLPHVVIPSGQQPRMSTIYHLRGLLRLLQHFMIIDDDLYEQVAASADWLRAQLAEWAPDRPEEENYAKQLAQLTIGKTEVFYGGELTWPLAYKWKISWNETAKNTAFWNQYPEFNHNEFIGWTSHPVEKPFAVFDLRSSLERGRIIERMDLSDRLLSGQRPKATVIELAGETLLQQILWGLVLADMASVYTAILNGVNPQPVELVERLKRELS